MHERQCTLRWCGVRISNLRNFRDQHHVEFVLHKHRAINKPQQLIRQGNEH
jgi:hypothetical protein